MSQNSGLRTRVALYYRLARQAADAHKAGVLTEQEVREVTIDAALETGILRGLASGEMNAPLLYDALCILCQRVLLPVEKMTEAQRQQYCDLTEDTDRVDWWNAYGFTRPEAKSMVRGSTMAKARKRYGGVWQAESTPFPQARSARHARKLFMLNFGEEPEDVRLV